MANKGNPDLVKLIVDDVKESIDEAQKQVDKIAYINIPNIKRTPLVIENNGKTTIHGERNPHLAFINNTTKGE